MNYKLPRKNRTPRVKHKHPLGKKFRKPIPRMVVPSFFTLMNLFCGFVSLIQVHEGRLVFGAWLIIIAGLFDALDGFMARLASATSSFGIELDSLSDIVSFGVAPGFLLYNYSFHEILLPGIILSALPAICGAVRLARFNVETTKLKIDYFRGLPIPAQASMIVAFYLTFNGESSLFSVFKYGINSILIPMVILLSLLMVSTVPFDKIPRFSKGYAKKHRSRILLFVAYSLAIIFFQEYGLMAVFTVFIGKGMIKAAISFWSDIKNNGDDGEENIILLDNYPSEDYPENETYS